MATNIKLLVGLGNPTQQYAQTRHNAGFWFLDEVAARARLQFRHEPRYHGEVATLDIAGASVYLLKPLTFMNRSGESVAALARFLKLEPDRILVAHDELDLPPGVVRLKRGGGHGGHNGLRDLISRLGAAEFCRLRFGIGHPGDRSRVVGYVLQAPPPAEGDAIKGAIARAMALFPELVSGPLESVMNRLHAAESAREENKFDKR